MKNESDQNWDHLIEKLHGNVLQSSAWMAFQERLGRQVVRDLGKDWAWQGIVRRNRLATYLDIPWGPVGESLAAIDSIKTEARKLGVSFVRFEPDNGQVGEWAAAGAREVASVQPKYPWVLDITQSEEDLRQGLNSGHRSAINAAERRGLSFRVADSDTDTEVFLRFMGATTARQHFNAHPDDYYRTMLEVLRPLGAAQLYMAEADGEPVAAALVLDFGGVRYYAHAGGDQVLNRKLQASAPLVWRMLNDAKQAGAHTFHFWGVTPSTDPQHPWAGFTKFKQGFGGHMDSRLGTWELPLRRGAYTLYGIGRKILR